MPCLAPRHKQMCRSAFLAYSGKGFDSPMERAILRIDVLSSWQNSPGGGGTAICSQFRIAQVITSAKKAIKS